MTIVRQCKPTARAKRTGHCGRTIGNARDHPHGVFVVRYPASGPIAFAPRGRPDIPARFVHGTAAHASPPDLAHLSPEKELLLPPSPSSFPLGQQFVYPRGNKFLSSNPPSGLSHLPTGEGQSWLQMAPGEGSLRSKEPITRPNDVTKTDNLERKMPVGDRSEGEKKGCTVLSRTKICGCRGRNGGSSAGAEGEGH